MSEERVKIYTNAASLLTANRQAASTPPPPVSKLGKAALEEFASQMAAVEAGGDRENEGNPLSPSAEAKALEVRSNTGAEEVDPMHKIRSCFSRGFCAAADTLIARETEEKASAAAAIKVAAAAAEDAKVMAGFKQQGVGGGGGGTL